MKYKKLLALTLLPVTIWITGTIYLLSVWQKKVFLTQFSKDRKYEVEHEVVNFENKAGNRIEAIYVKNTDANKVVLYLHGQGGTVAGHLERMARIYKVFSPSYPGYGNSEGKPTIANIEETADLALNELNKMGFRNGDIIVLGHSLGGYPAVYLASKYPDLDRVILVNTFDSIQKLAQERYIVLGRVFGGGIFNTLKLAPKTRARILQFHSTEDTYIKFKHGKNLFDHLASPNKKFIEIKGSHADFDVEYVLSYN